VIAKHYYSNNNCDGNINRTCNGECGSGGTCPSPD